MQYIDFKTPGAADVLVLAERPAPTCGDDEVLIKVHAAGVNRPDIFQRQGKYPAPAGASDILGLEVAGEITDVGKDVKRWQVGDRVCALTNGGGYAEYVNVPASQCLPIPKECSMVAAASLPETYFTVWSNVFDRCHLKAGETLLVHGGSSGIGVAAIQMANAMGAKIFVTAGSVEKCRSCEMIGAKAINYREQDFVEEIKAATNGKGVDVILDMVGGDYIQRNIKAAAPDGRIAWVNFQNGAKAELNMMPVMVKRLTLTGSTLRPQSLAVKAAIAANLEQHIWPHIEQGKIQPVIDSLFPLADTASAHARMESSAHIGKIILRVGE